MVKILSQSGNSLADLYDVEGSVAGIDSLETRELPIVHEMGSTVFSERFSGNVRRGVTAALTQNTAFDVILTDFGQSAIRIVGVLVFANSAGRVDNAMVAVRDPGDGREVPIWHYETSVDNDLNIRIDDNGAGAAAAILLRPVTLLENMPSMIIGNGQPAPMAEIAFRGLTSGFGAGTVITTVVLYTQFAEIGGISSRGLPIPSW